MTFLTNLLNGRLATRIKSFFQPDTYLASQWAWVANGHIKRVITGLFKHGFEIDLGSPGRPAPPEKTWRKAVSK